MNYAQENRLRTIDLLVDLYGNVNRIVIMEMFGIGPACVTRDFRAYRDRAPNNLLLDEKTKSYYKTKEFKRIFS